MRRVVLAGIEPGTSPVTDGPGIFLTGKVAVAGVVADVPGVRGTDTVSCDTGPEPYIRLGSSRGQQ
jgi:hypothetical protein